MELAHELRISQELATSAGRLALRYHGSALTVDRKSGNEPVTRADREASELIVSGLRREFPSDIVVSEEEADDPARRIGADRVWFIDPIDGTKDFIRGEDGFAVMIGLAIGGRPRLGVVYQPIGGRMYWATPAMR